MRNLNLKFTVKDVVGQVLLQLVFFFLLSVPLKYFVFDTLPESWHSRIVTGLSALTGLVAAFLWERFKHKLPSQNVPLNAEFLLYLFLDPATCDALVGDLEERYKILVKKFGKFKANLWYWSQAIRSTGPIAWAWFKKLVMKPVLAVLGWLLAHGFLEKTAALDLVKRLLAELLKKVGG